MCPSATSIRRQMLQVSAAGPTTTLLCSRSQCSGQCSGEAKVAQLALHLHDVSNLWRKLMAFDAQTIDAAAPMQACR